MKTFILLTILAYAAAHDPVRKNCAYGCKDGCPRDRVKGDTNGCASWESGNSFCNLSAENCESCRTEEFGRGEWCPATRELSSVGAVEVNDDVQYNFAVDFTPACEGPDCHQHCCSYHCAGGDCSKCTGWEPDKPTWCNASRKHCTGGAPAPNQGHGCGGTWCPGKCPGPSPSPPPPPPPPTPKGYKCGYYCQGHCGDCVSFSDSDFCNESEEHCADFCKGTYCKYPPGPPSPVHCKCGFNCDGDKCSSYSTSRFCQLDKANCEGACAGTCFPVNEAAQVKRQLRAAKFLRAMK